MSSRQIIVITGATAGLGLATTKALRHSATEPTTIILTSRDAVKGQKSVDEDLEAWSGDVDVKVVVKELNLDDDASVEKFRKEIQEEYGKVDVLIHNASEFSCPLTTSIVELPPGLPDFADSSLPLGHVGRRGSR